MRLTVALISFAASFCCARAEAQETRFGDWSVGVMAGEEGIYAATVNDSGGLLGQYCYKENSKCLWLLANDINCDAGSKYSVLINADSGAATTQVACVKIGGKSRYVFVDFDLIATTVRDSEWIGIASPLKNGRFQVSRFSLAGAARAVALVNKAVESAVGNASRSTRDEVY